MLASPFVGPIGKGELKIPAVRGVAGSLLYLIERPGRRGAFFDVDFVARSGDRGAARRSGSSASTTSPRSCAETELPSWVLYYRAILGLEPAERTDLADPHGLIVSRALANAARTLRLPLNASGAERSAAEPLPAADRGRRRPAHRVRLPRHLPARRPRCRRI